MNIQVLDNDDVSLGLMTSRLYPKPKLGFQGLTTTLVVKATYQLVSDGKAIKWPEGPNPCAGDLPNPSAEGAGLGYSTDFVPYKRVADFTAIGTAYPPQDTSESFPVIMRVGSKQKELKVFGPWKWIPLASGGEMPGPSGPLIPVPITYANAWGGGEYPLNPLGCGREGEKTPLLELPEAYISSRNYMGGPAVFAPMPSDSPYRKSKAGTYDKVWLEERWPWLPADFDDTFYNAAHPSQWMDGYLKGDEELVLENMHQSVPIYRSCLPGERVRCFVKRIIDWNPEMKKGEGKRECLEVPMNLDTLWVDMDQGKMVLVWRGNISCRSIKRKDLSNLLVVKESLDDPMHPFDYYVKNPAEKSSKNDSKKPDYFATMKADHEENMAMTAKIWDENMTKNLKEIEQVATELPAIGAILKSKYQQVISTSGNPFSSSINRLNKPPISYPYAAYHNEMEKISSYLATESERFIKSQNNTAEQKELFLKKIQEAEKALKKHQAHNDETKKWVSELQEEIEKIFPARKKIGDFQSKAAGPESSETTPDPNRFKEMGAVDADLTGADFSMMDLSGVDFSGALLNEASFQGATLRRCNFSGALMREADLTGADLESATLEGVDLSSCKVQGAIWKGARLNRANFSGLDLQGSIFSEASGKKTNFSGANLAGANFSKAIYKLAMFVEATMTKANFTQASLKECSFLGAVAPGVKMNGADLTKFAGGFGADFSHGSFQEVSAVGSSWGDSVLYGADFHLADLRGAMFSDAKLQEAHFDRCDLRETCFDDAVLKAACLTNANMMFAIFNRADLTGARLDGSNLHGASLNEATLLKSTWENALVSKTRLDPAANEA
jgi:uncharacterized protein YjbI with pentapeptide repeats